MNLRMLRRVLWLATASRRAALVVLALLLAACLVNLNYSPRPWKAGIGPRIAAGKKPTPKHYVATYNWYMAAANSALLLGLIATIPLWVRSTVALPQGDTSPGSRPDVLSWGLVATAAVALCYLAGPRLDHSLWGDEEYTFRRNFFGEYRRAEPLNPESPLKLQRVTWLDTVYGFKEPNNHIFQTILSRLCHDFWVKHFWEECRPQVGEMALRLPSFIAGLATLPALLALGSALGSPRAGAFAAMLLAFHPWFQRYVSEARGYAFVMLFTVLGLLLLILALRRGQWRWWILYGLTQFLLLWTYVTGVFVPLVLNIGALGWLAYSWRRQERRDWALSNGARFLVVNLVSAMAFFQMMLPCLPMLREYLAKAEGVPEKMDGAWFLDLGGEFLGGMDGLEHWRGGRYALTYWSWQGLAEHHRFLVGISIAKTVALVLLGLVALGRSGRVARVPGWLPLAWAVLPVSIALLHGQLGGSYYYAWYLIFALPCYALAWGLGVDQVGRWIGGLGRGKLPAELGAGVAAAAGLGIIVPHLFGQLWVQRGNPVEPLRETARVVHGAQGCYPYDGDEKHLTVMFLMPTSAYDPSGIRVDTLEQLRALEDFAVANQRQLAVHFGAIDMAKVKFPEIMKELEKSGRFREVVEFGATWPLLNRHIFFFRQPGPMMTDTPSQTP